MNNNGFRRLGRKASHRKALIAHLLNALIERESIETTLEKAKETQRYVDKLITRSKVDSLHNRRVLLSRLQNQASVHKLLSDLGPRFQARQGGYTRIVRLYNRVGDAALMAKILFVEAATKTTSKKPVTTKVAKPKKVVTKIQETLPAT